MSEVWWNLSPGERKQQLYDMAQCGQLEDYSVRFLVCSLTDLHFLEAAGEMTLATFFEAPLVEYRLPIGIQKKLYRLWTTHRKALATLSSMATH